MSLAEYLSGERTMVLTRQLRGKPATRSRCTLDGPRSRSLNTYVEQGVLNAGIVSLEDTTSATPLLTRTPTARSATRVGAMQCRTATCSSSRQDLGLEVRRLGSGSKK